MFTAPAATLGLVALVIIGLIAYATWEWLINATGGGLKQWVDADFPEVVHTPKPTWLTGFRYKKHGIDVVAKLETPICLEYDHAEKLGRFSVVDTFARSASSLDGIDESHEKDLVAYDFGMDLEQLEGGQVALQVIYNRISVTEIEPIIEDSACE
jgi:hypothetical protein